MSPRGQPTPSFVDGERWIWPTFARRRYLSAMFFSSAEKEFRYLLCPLMFVFGAGADLSVEQAPKISGSSGYRRLYIQHGFAEIAINWSPSGKITFTESEVANVQVNGGGQVQMTGKRRGSFVSPSNRNTESLQNHFYVRRITANKVFIQCTKMVINE